jgi:hypothetical protein
VQLATDITITREAASTIITRRLAFQPSTFNDVDKSVELVIFAGAAVQRTGYVEHLSSDPADWTIPAVVQLRDSHQAGTVRAVIGQVRNIHWRDGLLIGTAFIRDASIAEAVKHGDVTGVSLGARAKSHSDRREGGRVHRHLAELTLTEVSLTSDPADPAATVRSHTVEDEDIIIDTPEVTSEETTQRSEIRTICRSASMTAEQADELIDRGATVTEARAAAYEHITARRPRVAAIARTNDDGAELVTRQAGALACQLTGAAPTEAEQPFMAMGAHDIMREALSRAGVNNVHRLGREELVTRAMTTSDFPALLQSTGRRMLMGAYDVVRSPLLRLSVQRNLSDFRPASMIRVGGIPKLGKVAEDGEIKHVSRAEATEGFKLETFASIYGLSRQALINDDLGAFADWARVAGRAAAETERAAILEVLARNGGFGPTMEDGQPLFHASHGNLAPDDDLSLDDLSAARVKLRLQKGISGEPINAVPKFLLVDPTMETEAEKFLALLAATTVEDVNPFAGKLTLLVETGLPAGSWYLFADPTSLPVLAHGYLSSAPGPQLATRDGWDVLGREFRVVLDFGCGAVDWRGAYLATGEDI